MDRPYFRNDDAKLHVDDLNHLASVKVHFSLIFTKALPTDQRTVDPPMGSTAMRGRNARLCKSLQLITQHGYNVGTFRIRIGGHLVAFLWVNSPFEVAKMKK